MTVREVEIIIIRKIQTLISLSFISTSLNCARTITFASVLCRNLVIFQEL